MHALAQRGAASHPAAGSLSHFLSTQNVWTPSVTVVLGVFNLQTRPELYIRSLRFVTSERCRDAAINLAVKSLPRRGRGGQN